jgi:hypothetical protein
VVWANGVLASIAVGLLVDLLTAWSGLPPEGGYLHFDGNTHLVSRSARIEFAPATCLHFRAGSVGEPVFHLRSNMQTIHLSQLDPSAITNDCAGLVLGAQLRIGSQKPVWRCSCGATSPAVPNEAHYVSLSHSQSMNGHRQSGGHWNVALDLAVRSSDFLGSLGCWSGSGEGSVNGTLFFIPATLPLPSA